MTVLALSLPHVSAEDAAARRMLGAGVGLPFEVAGEVGRLQLTLGNGPADGTPCALECAHGVFSLSEAGPVLSLLGECPVVLPAEPGADAEWFWALFHQALSESVRAAFGFLKPSLEPGGRGIACRLDVQLGAACVVSHLEMAGATLLGLLRAAPWQRRTASWDEALALRIPLLVGHLGLGAGQLAALRPGDVLVPETPLFDAAGHGRIALGRHCLQVRVHSHATPLRLIVLTLEETVMSTTADTDLLTPEWDDTARYEPDIQEQAPEAASQTTFGSVEAEPEAGPLAMQAAGRFEDLPLALTVRCGHLSLTLSELRNLAPGAVLNVQGVAPGAGTLFHGERPLAHGELVEVDGRLGLQIARVDVAG